VVFCRDGEARLVAERETHEHVLALHRPALDLTCNEPAHLSGQEHDLVAR